MYSPLLKISGITHLADARYFASYGAEILGFCFNPESENFIQPYRFQEITGWLNQPILAGEFGKMKVGAVIEAVNSLRLNYAEIHYITVLHHSTAFKNIPLLIEVRLDEWLLHTDEILQLQSLIKPEDLFCFDFENVQIENINSEELKLILSFFRKFPTFSQYSFNTQNLSSHLEKIKPHGIVLKGSQELEIGVKSFEEIDAIMKMIQR